MKTGKEADDVFWMRRALRLARKGLGWTSPNPPVGAVVVKKGNSVGEGYHEGAGKPHAEAIALSKAGINAKGATLYLTLEPCNHFGLTPPCSQTIISAGVKRVVIASLDPNPIVNGEGIKRLKQAGIEVTFGVLAEEAQQLIVPFAKFITQKIPFVTLKLAMSADGKIATSARQSSWITSETARRYAHRLRHEHDTVMVGIGTILSDDPELTVRFLRGKVKQPIRVVVDSYAKTPPNAKVIRSCSSPCIIAVTQQAPDERVSNLEQAGAQVWRLPATKTGRVDLCPLLLNLAKIGVVSVLVEGGSELAGSFVTERLLDRIAFFVSPKLIGGRNAVTAVGAEGFLQLSDATRLNRMRWRRLGEDWLITADVENR